MLTNIKRGRTDILFIYLFKFSLQDTAAVGKKIKARQGEKKKKKKTWPHPHNQKIESHLFLGGGGLF